VRGGGFFRRVKKRNSGRLPVHASHLCRLVAQVFVECVQLAVLQAENAREDVTDLMASHTWPRDQLTRRSGLDENRRRRRSGARPGGSQRLPFRPPSCLAYSRKRHAMK
jgi:hypothetical protein